MEEKKNKSSDVYTSVDDVYTIIDDKESIEKILMMNGEQQLFQVITEDGIEPVSYTHLSAKAKT